MGEDKAGLKSFGVFTIGDHAYEVLFAPEWRIWFVRRLDGKRLRAVYQGDLEVEWVRDTALGEDFYLIRSSFDEIYGYDLDSVIKHFIEIHSSNLSKRFAGPFLRFLIERKGRTSGHFFGGFYADGFAEGYIPYPAESWDCEPKSLEAMTKRISETFPVGNRANALANVALAVAKVFSAGVRLERRGAFVDHVVINTPDVYPYLRHLIGDIIDLLGLNGWAVYFDAERPVYKLVEVLRDELMHSNAPIFLDEVDEQGLDVVLSVAVGNNFILRSVMVNTLLEYSQVRKVLTKHFKFTKYFKPKGVFEWAMRKMIIIKWDHMPMDRKEGSFDGKPILGCLRELWQDQDFRQRALKALSDVDLAEMTMEAFRTRYGVDTGPYVGALRLVAGGRKSTGGTEKP